VLRTRPLSLIAGGVALVALDFRTESLDLLPDPVGWALVAMGAWRLGLRLPALVAIAAAGLSASDAFLPYRYALVDPITDKAVERCPADLPPGLRCFRRLEFDPVSGWRLLAIAGALVMGAWALAALLHGLRRGALVEPDQPAAARLALLTWAVVVGWALPPAVALVGAATSDLGSYDPIWNASAEYVALIGLATMGWVALELCLRSGSGWALPRGWEQPSPWERHW
jgi:hypothetical protein